MFKHIIVDTWQDWAPIASFFLTAGIFGIAMLRACFMRKDEADHLASLPLDSTNPKPSQNREH